MQKCTYFDIYIDESRHLRMKEIGLKQRRNFERFREGLLEMALNVGLHGLC